MAGKQERRSNGQAREQREMDRGGISPEQEDERQRDIVRGGREPKSKTEELIILYTNAQSLFGKIDELIATTSILNPDIILLTETWTNCGITDAMIQLPGYKLEGRTDRQDTQNGIGGGLIFYVKECYDTEPVLDSTNTYNQHSMLTIKTKSGKLNLLLVYRPPSSNIENLDQLCELLVNAKNNTIAIGDFNLPKINYQAGTADRQGQRLLDAMEAANMVQLVDFPTHKKGNTLDLVVTNCQEKCKSVKDVGCLGASDHCMIELKIETGLSKGKMQSRKIWNKGDNEKIRMELNDIDWDNELAV
jgi:hypothetical protein